MIVNVERSSAAERAGLKPFQGNAHAALMGGGVGAALVFPPAILLLPIIDYSQVGLSYDLIIGVDGTRVTNFVDFSEQMRKVAPGELVYLSIVRGGRRLQIAVPITPLAAAASK